MIEWKPAHPDHLEPAVQFLWRQEALHSLPLGIINAWGQAPSDDVRIWCGWHESGVSATASVTRNLNIVLSQVDDLAVLDALVSYLQQLQVQLPGVIGPAQSAAHFAERWSDSAELIVKEMVYECREVTWPAEVPGSARFANENDMPLLMQWHEEFHRDADMELQIGAFDAEQTRKTIVAKLGNGGYVFWHNESGEPVSMAGFGSPSPHGMRIGPVYTPEQLRGNGFGAAVTAATTQHLLDSGLEFVDLFADLANPVSNHVYQKLGYREVGAFSVFSFNNRE